MWSYQSELTEFEVDKRGYLSVLISAHHLNKKYLMKYFNIFIKGYKNIEKNKYDARMYVPMWRTYFHCIIFLHNGLQITRASGSVSFPLLFFFYCCSSTVVSIFTPPRPLPSLSSTLQPTPFGFIHVSFIHVSWGPTPIIFLLLPLWLMSDCHLFQCLWLYFACLFVLLIRFHLQVRSYGISLSLLGLFHLA